MPHGSTPLPACIAPVTHPDLVSFGRHHKLSYQCGYFHNYQSAKIKAEAVCSYKDSSSPTRLVGLHQGANLVSRMNHSSTNMEGAWAYIKGSSVGVIPWPAQSAIRCEWKIPYHAATLAPSPIFNKCYPASAVRSTTLVFAMANKALTLGFHSWYESKSRREFMTYRYAGCICIRAWLRLLWQLDTAGSGQVEQTEQLFIACNKETWRAKPARAELADMSGAH